MGCIFEYIFFQQVRKVSAPVLSVRPVTPSDTPVKIPVSYSVSPTRDIQKIPQRKLTWTENDRVLLPVQESRKVTWPASKADQEAIIENLSRLSIYNDYEDEQQSARIIYFYYRSFTSICQFI